MHADEYDCHDNIERVLWRFFTRFFFSFDTRGVRMSNVWRNVEALHWKGLATACRMTMVRRHGIRKKVQLFYSQWMRVACSVLFIIICGRCMHSQHRRRYVILLPLGGTTLNAAVSRSIPKKNVMYWMGWQLSHGINTQENWSLSWWSWWKRHTLSVLLLRLCCILFFLFCHRECSCNIQTTWIQNMASETFFTCFRVIKYCIFAWCWDMAVPLPSARLLRKLNDIHIKLDWVIICVN